MRDNRLCAGPMGRLFLSCAAACLASGSALAASTFVVNKYITVQPITVCNSNGSGCAPVNDGSGAAIGFKDTNINPNDDTTDEIINKELFVTVNNTVETTRVTFLPLAQFNSPINPVTNTTWQTLHFASPTNDCNGLASTDFNTLTQWPFPQVTPVTTPPTYTVPNPTTPFSTKTCKIANGVLQPTCVPISSTPTTINMFFVNNMSITTTGCGATLTGFSQVNGNGIAINSGAVFNNSLIDVIPHEIMHNLSLQHVSTTSDLMAIGGSRVAPTLSCPSTNPPCLSSGLANGTVDQLNSTQTALVLDPSGFLNPILEVNASVTADTVANTFDFTVSIPAKNNGAPVSVISLIWEVPPPLGFSNPSFTVTNNPDGLNVMGSIFNGSLGNNGTPLLCGASSLKCFRVDITPPPAFGPGDTLSFSLAISNSNKNTRLSDLNGSTFTFLTSDQFATTSRFASNKSGTTLTVDSLMPALDIGSFVNDPNSFAASTQTPCTLSTAGQCPNMTVVDGL